MQDDTTLGKKISDILRARLLKQLGIKDTKTVWWWDIGEFRVIHSPHGRRLPNTSAEFPYAEIGDWGITLPPGTTSSKETYDNWKQGNFLDPDDVYSQGLLLRAKALSGGLFELSEEIYRVKQKENRSKK